VSARRPEETAICAVEVIIQKDPAAASRLAAALIAKALRAKPHMVLGLATGATMAPIYAELVRLHREENLDFSLCRTFNLDEYVGIPPDDPHSFRYFMNRHLFDLVNIDKRNTHVPNGLADDFREECLRYERLIKECGGIDLQLLGIGVDGHIGFNEPLSSLLSRTREKALTPATIEQNAKYFSSPSSVPRRGITMGVGTILDSRECLLVATGREKADIVARAFEGPITSMVTASALQLHPRCRVIVDEAAASRMQGADYYRWIFENEPEWAEFR